MRIVTALSVLALVGICTGAAYANPANSSAKPWSYPNLQSRAIYPEDEGVNNSCPGQVMVCGDEINPAAIDPASDQDWVQFYVANAGDLISCRTGSSDGTTMDTYIELYDVCGGTMLTYDDDGGGSLYSFINNFPAPHAGWYYLLVHSFAYASTGTYKLDVTCGQGTPPPPDDVCSGAGSWERCTSGSISGDLTPYNNDYDPGVPGPSCTGYPEAGKDQVVRLDLQVGDVVAITYTGLAYDAAIYLITDCSNPSGSCVDGADATVGGQAEVLNYTVTVAGTYYLILDAYGTGAGGPYTLNYDLRCPGATGACCVNYVCTITTQGDCTGTYYGDGSVCTTDLCGHPVPVKTQSWGQIKATYR